MMVDRLAFCFCFRPAQNCLALAARCSTPQGNGHLGLGALVSDEPIWCWKVQGNGGKNGLLDVKSENMCLCFLLAPIKFSASNLALSIEDMMVLRGLLCPRLLFPHGNKHFCRLRFKMGGERRGSFVG